MDNDGLESQKRRIFRLVDSLCTSIDKELDKVKMKELKLLCKEKDDNISEVCNNLFAQVRKKNSDIRLLSLKLFDQLFSRSHFFRTLVIERFDELSLHCLGLGSVNPLPPPAGSARALKAAAIQVLKRWIERFDEGYAKLKICAEVLERKVNFDSMSLIHDVDESNRSLERERMEGIWRGRIIQVEKEVEENQEVIDQAVTETRNCVGLWKEGGSNDLLDPRTTAVCDQYNFLIKRLIPLAKKWTVTLTKAGRFTNHQLFRKCVDLKNVLDSVFAEVVGLHIDFKKYNDRRHVVTAMDDKEKPRDAELFSDPTTWAASLIKLKNKKDIPGSVLAKALNLNFLAEKPDSGHAEAGVKQEMDQALPYDDSKSIENNETEKKLGIFDRVPSPPPSTSKHVEQLRFIPTLKATELLTSETIVCDTDKQSVWVNNGSECEGKSFTINQGVRRVVDFRGKFEPVTHICRATLEGGALCSRRDRVKCPFHGIIVVRDDEGNVVDSKEVKSSLNNQQEVVGNRQVLKEKKSKPKTRKLKSEATTNTSRARIEKIVFNKRAVKRVSANLDAADRRKTKAQFSEQFNYSM